MKKVIIPIIAALGMFAATVVPAVADMDKPHKMVIQVSSADPAVHKLALNNAVNMQKALGPDEIDIEIVAYGPGLSIMTPQSPESSRIPDLALQEITFSACGNTMKKVAAKSGKDVVLVEGVRVVPAGVLRIMELQEQGYTYIRP
ncbi:MAG: hypothetical protein DHS20C01_10860 [marine bacterium B5-7]|nr:MAG: hypothetical protein DHS20C01_10860 [marine bacterium B5-7]